MKRIKLLYVLLILLSSCSKQENNQQDTDSFTSNIKTGKIIKSVNVAAIKRDYIVHIPEQYNGKAPLPLLLCFHGLTSNMEFNYSYTKFYELAEQENFIVVHPNGLSNKWTVNALNNPDIDFVETLLNQLELDYNIDSSRIYSTGMSNGGFFSFSLACNLSNRIAAVASVTGTMFSPLINNCTPTRPLPILQIHGTKDDIVEYSTALNALDYWKTHNKTSLTPIISNMPNLDDKDGSTVQRFDYVNTDNNIEVRHFKIIGGGHDWPGFKGNMDINATVQVWNFVKKFSLNGKIN